MNLNGRDERALESWKDIAAYLQRDARTARNWEKSEGLPVHRHSHKSRSSVYAYPSEIDAWRAGRRVVSEPEPAGRPWWRPVAAGITTLLCLVMVGNSVRPQVVSAQQGAPQADRQIWASAVAGGAGSGSISRDGRYLTFTNWDTGDLEVRDLTTGADRALTDSGGWETSGDYSQQSAISPDQRQIAYHWFTNGRDEVRIIPRDGGAPRTIYRPTDSSEYILPWGWTPDGTQILATQTLSGTTRIVLLAVQDGSIRPLKSRLGTMDAYPAMSPDGRYVAYDDRTGKDTQSRDIFVLPVEGGRETAVGQGPADDYSPVWSPDGSALLFMSDRTGSPSLWKIPMQAGKPSGPAAFVKDNVGGRFVRPLGISTAGALYYVRPGGGRSNVYIADLNPEMAASKPPAIATDRYVNSNLGPAWSPDGQRLAYYSVRGSALSYALMVRTLKTGEEREVSVHLPLAPHFNSGPRWFPDGRSVLIAAREPNRAVISFYRVELAGGKADLLYRPSAGVQGYALSPDGKAIFYSKKTNSDPFTTNLVRWDLKPRTETVLKSGEWCIEVAVSPDSKRLAYLVSTRPGSASYLAVMPAGGGAEREVFRGATWVDGSRYSALSWTPDGKSLVFVRGDEGSRESVVWRVPVAGGQPVRMSISSHGQIKMPSIDPEGRRIAFGESDNSAGEVWALENFLPAGRK